jgi:hypothetical protein
VFSCAFGFRVCKKRQEGKKLNRQNSEWVKKGRIWYWFRIHWKSCKKCTRRKLEQNSTKRWKTRLHLLLLRRKLFWRNWFATFLTDYLKISNKFCVLWYPNWFFIKTVSEYCLQPLKPNAHKTGRNSKKFFYNRE